MNRSEVAQRSSSPSKGGAGLQTILDPVFTTHDVHAKIVKQCNISLCADDTAIYVQGENNEILEHRLQSDLNRISDWLLANKLSINVKKCKILRVSTRQHRTRVQPLNISINNSRLEQVTSYKYLGYWLDDTLCFNQHIQKTVDKINKRLYLIKQSSKFLPQRESLRLYKCLILPVFDYGDTLYMHTSQENLTTLQVLQNKFAKTILKVNHLTSTDWVHNELKLMKLEARRKYHMAILVFKTVKGLVPNYLSDKVRLLPEDRGRITRSNTRQDLEVPYLLLYITRACFTYQVAVTWNSFPAELRESNTVGQFKSRYLRYYGFV